MKEKREKTTGWRLRRSKKRKDDAAAENGEEGEG